MKLVREHINEKFTADSDPIKDMGIGSAWVRLKQGDIIMPKRPVFLTQDYHERFYKGNKMRIKELFFTDKNKYGILENSGHSYIVINTIKLGDKLKIEAVPFGSLTTARSEAQDIDVEDWITGYWWVIKTATYKTWEKYFEIAKNES